MDKKLWDKIFRQNSLVVEQDDEEKEKVDKEKEDLAQQKQDLDQKKFDFQQQQAGDADREADKRDDEKEKEEREAEAPQGAQAPPGGGAEKKSEPNISFKTQGTFYKEAMAGINNIQLSDGDLLDDEEKNYVALAVQASEGRFDKNFEKFLRQGKAGNVYGKDFSDKDIERIMNFCKEHDIVR